MIAKGSKASRARETADNIRAEPNFSSLEVSMRNLLDPNDKSKLTTESIRCFRMALLDCFASIAHLNPRHSQQVVFSYPWPHEKNTHEFYNGFYLKLSKEVDTFPDVGSLLPFPLLTKVVSYDEEKKAYVLIEYVLYAPIQDDNLTRSDGALPGVKWESQRLSAEMAEKAKLDDINFEQGEIFVCPRNYKGLFELTRQLCPLLHSPSSQERHSRYIRYKSYLPFLADCFKRLDFDVYLDQNHDATNKNLAANLATQFKSNMKIVYCLSPLYKYKMLNDKHVTQKENTIVNNLWFGSALKSEQIIPIYFESVSFDNNFTPARLVVRTLSPEGSSSLEDNNIFTFLYEFSKGALNMTPQDARFQDFVGKWRLLLQYIQHEIFSAHDNKILGGQMTTYNEQMNEREKATVVKMHKNYRMRITGENSPPLDAPNYFISDDSPTIKTTQAVSPEGPKQLWPLSPKGTVPSFFDTTRNTIQDFEWNIHPNKSRHVSCRAESELNSFMESMDPSDNPIVVLHGAPGSGKTHLARQILNSVDKGKFSKRLFINARSKEILLDQYRKIVMFGKLPGINFKVKADNSDSLVLAAIKDYFSENPGWAIVYDNAESYDSLQNFLPIKKPGLVIVTTSAEVKFWEKDEAPVSLINVCSLTVEESNELFLSSLGIDSNKHTVKVDLTSYLNGKKTPYAIIKAASYILNMLCDSRPANVTPVKINLFLQRYNKIAQSNPTNEQIHTWLIEVYKDGIAKKLEAIDKSLPNACLIILNFFSLFYKEGLSRRLLLLFSKNLGVTEVVFKRALGYLESYGLIYEETIDADTSYFSIDGVTQEVLRKAKNTEMLNELSKKTAGNFIHYLHKDKFDLSCDQREDLVHFFEFLAFLSSAQTSEKGSPSNQHDAIYIEIFRRAQRVYTQLSGHEGVNIGIKYGEKALYLTGFYFGTENLKYVKCLCELAHAYAEVQGSENTAKAIQYYNQAKNIIDSLHSSFSAKKQYKPSMLKGLCYRGIGLCYFNLALSAASETQKNEYLSFSIQNSELSLKSLDESKGAPALKLKIMQFRTKNNLALAYWRNGDLNEAVTIYKELLASKQKMRIEVAGKMEGKGAKLEEAIVRVNLGMCQYELRDFQGGVESLEGIVELAEAISNHPGLGVAYFYLGMCMLSSGSDIDRACVYIGQGMIIVKENVTTPEHAFVRFIYKELDILKPLIEKYVENSEDLIDIIEKFERWRLEASSTLNHILKV